jgi:PAS domain S-box-containing protein
MADEIRKSPPAGLKQTEDALRESEEKYRTLIENINIGVFRSTYDGTFLQINPAMAVMLGYDSVAELTATHTSALLCDSYAVNDFLASIRHREGIRNKEMILRRKDGSVVVTSITARARFGDDGTVAWIDGVIEDITERRAIEDLYRTLSEKSFAGLYVLQDGVFKYINPNAAASTEYSPAEVVGMSARSIVHPEDGEKVRKYSRNMLKGFSTSPYRYRIMTRSGKARWIMETVSSIVYRGRRAILGNSMDVTERFAAEERIRESQQQLASIIEFLPDATMVIDRDGTVLAWNKEMVNMSGVAAEAILGKSNYEYALPFYGSRRPILADLALKPGAKMENSYTFLENQQNLLVVETDAPMVKGQKRILWAKAAPIYDTKGEITGTIETIRDITERKNLESQLQKSEELYRTLVENHTDPLCRWDRNFRLTYVNESYCRLFGRSREELLGSSWMQFIPGDTRKRLIEFYNALIEQPMINTYEHEIAAENGTRWLIWTDIPLFDANGKLLEYQSVGKDLTERKKSEEALRKSENLYRTIFENTGAATIIAGEDTVIKLANSVFEEMTGYRRDDIENKRSWLDLVPGKNAEKMKAYHFARRLGGDAPQVYDFTFFDSQGRERDALMHVTLIPGTSDSVASFVDITERKRAERELFEKEVRLKQAEKMESLGLLAGGVAHDLNNVFSGLVGYPEIVMMQLNALREQPDPEKINRFLGDLPKKMNSILKSAQMASDIVQDLLAMTRRGVMEDKTLNLNDIVREYLNSAKFHMVEGFYPNIKIETVLDKGLFNMDGSRTHLLKSVMNLISNAFEAIPEGKAGEIHVCTYNFHADSASPGPNMKDGDYIVLEVRDSGIGIPAEFIDHIFEPFFTKKKMGKSGTGLGLSVVWYAVKDHRGIVEVESDEGRGSTFRLYFPASDKPMPGGAELESQLMRGNGEQILVVDDKQEQRDYASLLLATLGYAVHTVSSGEKCVEFLKKGHADLILLDMIMDPGIDGLDTFREVLKIRPGQKAIIVSGFSETDRVREAQKLGAGSYIKKPYLMKTIARAIREELSRQARRVP